MENDYKQEIIQSRKGALGGSDANLLKQIAELGSVPKSAYKRLAITKGLIEQQEITTAAMRFGDFIEQKIFAYLSNGNKDYLSNYQMTSKKFSKKNVKLICHPDFMYVDTEKKVVNVYECKASRYNVKATKETYRPQMFVEWKLAQEYASELGGYKVRLFLVHYDASDVDLNDDFESQFDENKITLAPMFRDRDTQVFDIAKAMSIVNDFLETFDVYYEDEEIQAEYLPEKVRNDFDLMTGILTEIKERETKVEEFKAKLYEFMLSKDIKSIKSDQWTISRVDATESVTFDSKTFLADYAEKHPQLCKKIRNQYAKRTMKKGYVSIKIKK